MEHLLRFFIAYIVGSFPSAVVIGKLFYGKDVREHGSKNSGATNTFRVLGAKAGIVVLLLDIMKGVLAVSTAYFFKSYSMQFSFEYYKLLLGLTAVMGHVFSLFVKFKGGKGVATMVGVVAAVFPLAALVGVSVFIIVFSITRYVSLGSMLGALSFPVVVILFEQQYAIPIVVISVFIPALIVFTHRSNIKRLLNKEETRLQLFGKNKPESK